jgi:hypothetical protein
MGVVECDASGGGRRGEREDDRCGGSEVEHDPSGC